MEPIDHVHKPLLWVSCVTCTTGHIPKPVPWVSYMNLYHDSVMWTCTTCWLHEHLL